jgi:hypothetical protein
MKNEVNESLMVSADYREHSPETYKGLLVIRTISQNKKFETQIIATVNSGSFRMDMYFVGNMLNEYHELPVFYSSTIGNYITDAKLIEQGLWK